MRTTLTLEADLAAALKTEARRSGRPLKRIVNEALRAGLAARKGPPPRRYRQRAIEHGFTVCSTDSDFKRFPGLQHVNPLNG
jgi:hypothetical protein